MTGEIPNPAKFLLPLFSAEEEFARCLAEGKPCIIGDGELPKKRIESGKGANVVRGEVVRFFAYGGNKKSPVLGSEVYLQGAWISGGLHLIHAIIPRALLLFHNCYFDTCVMMPCAECAALYLNGSYLANGLHADGLITKDSVNLWDDFSAKGKVSLSKAKIGGDLNCAGGTFHNPGREALFADKLTTKGNVNLRDGFSAEGEVRLSSADIGGDLNCAGGTFHNMDGVALSADKLTTKGNVNLRDGFSTKGEVRLSSADIGGDVFCAGGVFYNPGGVALSADKLMTKGNVNLSWGFSAEGGVGLSNADINGDLNCAGGTFHNLDGVALSADKLMTKGNVNLGWGFSAEGGVGLSNADINGDLNCMGGTFHNSDGNALDIGGGNISGSLFWRNVTCKGDVNLKNAKADILADGLNSWKSCKVNLKGFIYGQFADPVGVQFRIDWLAKRPDNVPFSTQPYEQAAKVLRAAGKDIDAWDIEWKKRRLERAERGLLEIPKWRRLWGWAIDELTDFVYRPWKTFIWALAVICLSAFLFNIADKSGRIAPHQSVVLANMKYQAEASPRCVEFQCPLERRPTTVVRRLFPDYPEFNALVFSLDVFIPFFALHQEPFWAPASGGNDTVWMLLLPLALFLIWLVITIFFARQIRRLRRAREDDGLIWAAVGMALVLSLGIAVAGVAGVAHVFFDAESALWLVDGQRLVVWYWLEIGAGWVLTSLFLLSITGLLRPRQSSS